MPVNLVEIDYELTEIFDKNRYNGQVGNCNVSVGRYNNLADAHSDMFFILVYLTVSDIHVHSISTSVYLAGIYCHHIISIWNALPGSDSGVTAPTLSIFNSCLRSIHISVFLIILC